MKYYVENGVKMEKSEILFEYIPEDDELNEELIDMEQIEVLDAEASMEYNDSKEEQLIKVESTDSKGVTRSSKRRAEHNALERRRRDKLREFFCGLRDVVPSVAGVPKVSRMYILQKARDYIEFMQRKIRCHNDDIRTLKIENQKLHKELRYLKSLMINAGENHASDEEINVEA